MTCFPLAVMAVAPFSGALSDRLGTRGLAVAGAALCAAALVAMAFLLVAAPAMAVGWRLAFFGLGTGIFQSPNHSAVMGSVPRPHLGIASGILGTARNTGMALGIAAAGLILYSLVPPTAIVQEYLSGQEAISFIVGLKYAYGGRPFRSGGPFFPFRQTKEHNETGQSRISPIYSGLTLKIHKKI